MRLVSKLIFLYYAVLFLIINLDIIKCLKSATNKFESDIEDLDSEVSVIGNVQNGKIGIEKIANHRHNDVGRIVDEKHREIRGIVNDKYSRNWFDDTKNDGIPYREIKTENKSGHNASFHSDGNSEENEIFRNINENGDFRDENMKLKDISNDHSGNLDFRDEINENMSYRANTNENTNFEHEIGNDMREYSNIFNPNLQRLYTKYYLYNKYVLNLNYWKYLPQQQQNNMDPQENTNLDNSNNLEQQLTIDQFLNRLYRRRYIYPAQSELNSHDNYHRRQRNQFEYEKRMRRHENHDKYRIKNMYEIIQKRKIDERFNRIEKSSRNARGGLFNFSPSNLNAKSENTYENHDAPLNTFHTRNTSDVWNTKRSGHNDGKLDINQNNQRRSSIMKFIFQPISDRTNMYQEDAAKQRSYSKQIDQENNISKLSERESRETNWGGVYDLSKRNSKSAYTVDSQVDTSFNKVAFQYDPSNGAQTENAFQSDRKDRSQIQHRTSSSQQTESSQEIKNHSQKTHDSSQGIHDNFYAMDDNSNDNSQGIDEISRGIDDDFQRSDDDFQTNEAFYQSENNGTNTDEDHTQLSAQLLSKKLHLTFKHRKLLHYNKYLNIYNWTDDSLDNTVDDYDEDEDGNVTSSSPSVTQSILLPSSHTTEKPKHGAEVKKDPLFPPDPFTMEQKRSGAVIVYIIGLLYMFIALAVVCDEFFVPSLDVIIERLGVQEDVAGATFMAAGGSAPELFTSVIGVFVSFDDVGIGTIVGSAVFNILFVIGVCGIFSRSVLTLTWWPLFRDCTFYSISLIILIIFFSDNKIELHEAAILFSVYIAYVSFMKFNRQMEHWVKTSLLGGSGGEKEEKVATDSDRLMPLGPQTAAQNLHEGSSITQSSSGAGSAHPPNLSAKNYRSCLVQLMVSTLDPLHDGVLDERAAQLTALASLKVLLAADDNNNSTLGTKRGSSASSGAKGNFQANGTPFHMMEPLEVLESPAEPLDMSWPESRGKQISYVLLAPLLFPLWLTLPDTRGPRGKKLFVITFIGSIMWIALYSYLMVWWADISGKVAQIPPEVMGFTFLAAGTSIPDLITSVIVARKGFGDMAVSSSVGSNIFDVTVGLPLPWLLYNIIYSSPVKVSSKGMLCSIIILFMMLLFVIVSIATFRWKLHRGLGITMFFLYFGFVMVSLGFEYGYVVCPY
uniref:Sodium/potassium/calcium exchanger Nckx30C n=1 Tax=Cacopsylla melanoneura TaxID=428564 RepID=A0A8D9DPL0_9HEMI